MTKAKTREREPTPDLLGDVMPKVEAKAEVIAPAKSKAAPKPKKNEIATVERLPTSSPQNLLMALMAGIADPDSKPEKVHVLLDARDRLMKQEAYVAFVAAYIEMQDELPVINAKGRIEIEPKPGARSQRKQSTPYATYQEINRVTKPILRKHKFALMLLPDIGPSGTGILMRGKLAYVCETPYGKLVHTEECAILSPPETGGSKNATQGVGSALSYTKRYAAIALLNLVSHAQEDKDDDAVATGKKGEKAEPPPKEIVFVSPKQIEELHKAIEDCGVGLEVVYDKYGVADLKELTADLMPAILQACARFKANRPKRGPE